MQKKKKKKRQPVSPNPSHQGPVWYINEALYSPGQNKASEHKTQQ